MKNLCDFYVTKLTVLCYGNIRKLTKIAFKISQCTKSVLKSDCLYVRET